MSWRTRGVARLLRHDSRDSANGLSVKTPFDCHKLSLQSPLCVIRDTGTLARSPRCERVVLRTQALRGL